MIHVYLFAVLGDLHTPVYEISATFLIYISLSCRFISALIYLLPFLFLHINQLFF